MDYFTLCQLTYYSVIIFIIYVFLITTLLLNDIVTKHMELLNLSKENPQVGQATTVCRRELMVAYFC